MTTSVFLVMSHPLDATLGALLIGYTFSVLLCGIALLQVYSYTRLFRAGDRTAVRVLVVIVATLQVFYQTTLSYGGYEIFIRSSGLSNVLKTFPITFDIAIVSGTIMDALVQLFFISRTFAATGQKVLCSGLVLLLAARSAVSITLGVRAFQMTDLHDYLHENQFLFAASWTISVCLDLAITAILCTALWKKRQMAGKITAPVVDRAMVWSIETGLLTSTMGVAIMISFFSARSHMAWLAMYILLPGLFTNSLFAALNGRVALRATMEDADGVAIFSTFIAASLSVERSMSTISHGSHKRPLGDVTIDTSRLSDFGGYDLESNQSHSSHGVAGSLRDDEKVRELC